MSNNLSNTEIDLIIENYIRIQIRLNGAVGITTGTEALFGEFVRSGVKIEKIMVKSKLEALSEIIVDKIIEESKAWDLFQEERANGTFKEKA